MTLNIVNFTVGASTLIDLEENMLYRKDYCSSKLLGRFLAQTVQSINR